MIIWPFPAISSIFRYLKTFTVKRKKQGNAKF